jgi:hypothetical protein
MPDQMDPKDVDKRIADRLIRAGKLDEKAWDKHNKALADSGEKAVVVESTMADDIDDEDEDDDDEDEGEE